IAALLANPSAKIRAKTLEKLVEDASKIEAWHEPLALRADLSPRAIRRIATFVGASLVEILCKRHGLDEDTRQALSRQLRRHIDTPQHPSAAGEKAPDFSSEGVAQACREARLAEAFVEDATLARRGETVVSAL